MLIGSQLMFIMDIMVIRPHEMMGTQEKIACASGENAMDAAGKQKV